jgi:hypothetical protein
VMLVLELIRPQTSEQKTADSAMTALPHGE